MSPPGLADIVKRLDHLDGMAHEVLQGLAVLLQFVADNGPALERAKRMLGNPVADYLAARKRDRG